MERENEMIVISQPLFLLASGFNEGKILRTPACLLSLQIPVHFTAVNVIDFESRERV